MTIIPEFHDHAPETALFSAAFPCNPRPFAKRIGELCEFGGTVAIQSDAAKACLLVLVQQAWGQCVTVDTVDEYNRIDKANPGVSDKA